MLVPGFLFAVKLNLHTQYIPHGLGGFLLCRGGDMGIGIQGEACGEVAEHSRDGFDVHAVLESDGCKDVAEVMESDIRDARHLQYPQLTLSGEVGPPLGERCPQRLDAAEPLFSAQRQKMQIEPCLRDHKSSENRWFSECFFYIRWGKVELNFERKLLPHSVPHTPVAGSGQGSTKRNLSASTPEKSDYLLKIFL